MPLQSSGAISLNEIHIEAGGNTGTTATINDADIRGLIGKSSGATMSFNEWYGASSVAYWGVVWADGHGVTATTNQYPYFNGSNRYGGSNPLYDSTNNKLYVFVFTEPSSGSTKFGAGIIELDLSDGSKVRWGTHDYSSGNFRPNSTMAHGNNLGIIDSDTLITTMDIYGANTTAATARATTMMLMDHSGSNAWTVPSGGHYVTDLGNAADIVGGDLDYGGLKIIDDKIIHFGKHSASTSGNGFCWIECFDTDYSNGDHSTFDCSSSDGDPLRLQDVAKIGSNSYAICGHTTDNDKGVIGNFSITNNQAQTWSGVRHTFSGGTMTRLCCIAVDGSGNRYCAGMAQGNVGIVAKFNSSNVFQWAREVSITSGYYLKLGSIAIQSGGNIIVAGVETNFSNSAQGMWVAAFNSSGTIQWQKHVFYELNTSSTKQSRMSWKGANQGTFYQRSCMCLGPSDSVVLVYRSGAIAIHGDGSTSNQTPTNWSIQGASRTITNRTSSEATALTYTASSSPDFKDRLDVGGSADDGGNITAGGIDTAKVTVSD